MRQKYSIAQYEGLSGWLIIVGIGIFGSLFISVTEIFPGYWNLARSADWGSYIDPENEQFNPAWVGVFVGEAFIETVLFLLTLYLFYLFFSKNRRFPNLDIFLNISNLTYLVGDEIIVYLFLPNEELFETDAISAIAGATLVVVIWVPYMLVSRRVKATFVNPGDGKEDADVFS